MNETWLKLIPWNGTFEEAIQEAALKILQAAIKAEISEADSIAKESEYRVAMVPRAAFSEKTFMNFWE